MIFLASGVGEKGCDRNTGTKYVQFPETFFELTGQSPALSNHYSFSSIEVKDLAFRIDDVFLPTTNDPDLPICFVEAQFQYDTKFYSRFFTEISNYLHQ